MKRMTFVFASILLFVSITDVRADLIEIDLVSGSGDKLITRDTLANLEWLDMSESIGRNFNDVSTQFGVGGDFEGWRYATASNVEGLWLNAGITNIDGGPTLGNFSPIQGLFNLIGETFVSSTRSFVHASTAEISTMFPGNLIGPILTIDPVPGLGNARIQGGAVPPDHADSLVSNWLIRDVTDVTAVPEPSTWMLFLTGLMILIRLKKWERA